MKLHKFKILTRFRGLPRGFEIKFNPSENGERFEPNCLVGLNGSGKSNVLEAISEIFYYLESYHLVTLPELKKSEESNQGIFSGFKAEFGFEIEYSLPRHLCFVASTNWDELRIKLEKDFSFLPVFKIIKRKGEYPELAFNQGNNSHKLINGDNNRNINILPARIIGYSSGMNELISNPFMKMDFYYYDQFRKQSGMNQVQALDLNRMFFMDYESNKLITVCNFLFDNKEQSSSESNATIAPLKEELGIKDIHSFSITIKLKDNNNRPLLLPSELNIAIENLKNCATCFNDNAQTDAKTRQIELYFKVNDATKSAFKNYFYTADGLYRMLYYLRLYNNSLISTNLREIIKHKKGVNISSVLPKHEQTKLVFSLHGLALRKKESSLPIHYEKLSDGEHQLLHVLGAIVLLDTPGSLFILDEPETHFNPEWRSKFVSLINSCLGNNKREQEVFITSHSPFIISDCKRANVLIFNKNEKSGKIHCTRPDFNTFGASNSIITDKVFQKSETIANMSLKEIQKIKQMPMVTLEDIQNAKEASRVLGESPEKFLLFRELIIKEDELNKNA